MRQFFKSLDIKQQRTLFPKKWKKKSNKPYSCPNLLLWVFLGCSAKKGNPGRTWWVPWLKRLSWGPGTRQLMFTEYWRGQSCAERIPKSRWFPLRIWQSTQQCVWVRKLHKANEPPKGLKWTIRRVCTSPRLVPIPTTQTGNPHNFQNIR